MQGRYLHQRYIHYDAYQELINSLGHGLCTGTVGLFVFQMVRSKVCEESEAGLRGQGETLSTHDSQCHNMLEVKVKHSPHDSQCHDVFIQIIRHCFGLPINLLQRGPHHIHPQLQLFAHCGCIPCPHWWEVIRAKRAGADLFHRGHSQGLHQVLVRDKIAPPIVIKASNRTASL